MGYLELACRTALLVLFAVALAGKTRSRAAFAEFVRSTRALGGPGGRWATPVAIGVIGAETGVVVLLAVPATARIGFALATVLLMVFTGTTVRAVRTGRRAPCACFGRSSTPVGWPHVIRNGLLLGHALTGLALGPGAVAAGGAAVASAGAAIVVLLVLRLDDLVSLFASPGPAR